MMTEGYAYRVLVYTEAVYTIASLVNELSGTVLTCCSIFQLNLKVTWSAMTWALESLFWLWCFGKKVQSGDDGIYKVLGILCVVEHPRSSCHFQMMVPLNQTATEPLFPVTFG